MNTLDIKKLLPELKKQVTLLADDLLTRVTGDAKINDGLQDAFQQIEQGGRTAQAYEVWLEDYLDQVAVAWVLSCVFVRFMEDNGLIDECWLAGEGPRRKLAEDTHELFFREHPRDSDREYFQHVFREVGKIPAAADLFAEGKTPLWAVGPSGDAAMKLLSFWREQVEDMDNPPLKRSFQVESGDTRFLGDLYQELSERAKKKYALLQTPVFVEEFILDRTLTPAIDEFGLEKVRMIDPTCGSGHFLLGGFARLFKLWSRPEYTTGNAEKDAQKALDGVWGVDINPFAVAIARFRLIVAAVQACGIRTLRKAAAWKVHLATGDSLLFGSRWNPDGTKQEEVRYLDDSWAPEIYACEDKQVVKEVLGQQYHVVVGNPPYIIVRDRNLNAAYRERYAACAGKYSLAVPFAERFLDLCVTNGNGKSGYVGMITANSFMKREFGKKLIEQFFCKIDLTHVIDTSGAYIPGHGTPTVILLARNRKPTSNSVRAVLGIKGEPSTPEDASQGFVWQSIVKHIDMMNAQDEFTSSADVPRSTFNAHPWSIGGGGATDVLESLESTSERTLSDFTDSIGITCFTLEDDVYIVPSRVTFRQKIPIAQIRQMVVGDTLRDWTGLHCDSAIFPYDSQFRPIHEDAATPVFRFLWAYRTNLGNSKMFGGETKIESGLRWYEYGRLTHSKLRTALTITFAEIASHNHFVLDRGGKVFNRTAPVIKLPTAATEDDHLALLGLLNSSASCFYMKQVCHQKQMMGGDGIRISSRAKVPYQYAGTRLQELPIPDSFGSGDLHNRLLELTRRLERCASQLTMLTAERAIQDGLADGEHKIREIYGQFQKERRQLRSAMVFFQEEVDFTCYAMFGLADQSLFCDQWDWPNVATEAGVRPFELLQQRNLDDFPVPQGVPSEWPSELQSIWQKRMEAIQKSKDLALIEDDHYKRRWMGRQGLFNHTARQNELQEACKSWLLDRLETTHYWPDPQNHDSKFQSTAQLADKASSDHEFLQVATLYRGRPDFDVSALVSELVETESVPLLPILRYKPAGLRKREIWERTWELQRQQDAGKDIGHIPVPPKYATADFLKADYRRLRGNLDVPKERWISFPHCSTDSDPSLVVGWAGWNHLAQATALVAYYDARKRDGWTAERLKPLLAGLDQLIPWIHQWHPEVDPEYGETAGQSFQHMLESDAHELGLTLDEIRNWTPPEKPAKVSKKKASTKQPKGEQAE